MLITLSKKDRNSDARQKVIIGTDHIIRVQDMTYQDGFMSTEIILRADLVRTVWVWETVNEIEGIISRKNEREHN